MNAPSFHSLVVEAIEHDTDDAVVVTFAVPPALADAFRFRHGQYVTLRVGLDGEELRRSYSICSPVGGPLRVGIKQVDGGAVSSWANTELRVGDTIDVMTPAGRFTSELDPAAAHRYVCVAAGSGVTPVLSIVSTVLAAEPLSQVTLVYVNRSARSAMFVDEFDDLKARHLGRLSTWFLFSRDQTELELCNGRLDRDRCRMLIDHGVLPVDADGYFLCGPQPMTEGVTSVLRAAGVAADAIHIELFAAATPPIRRHAVATGPVDRRPVIATVTARCNGRTTTFGLREGDVVLDAGLPERPELPYSCHAGVCATCRARVTEGAAAMDVAHGLEPAEIAAGFVLTCQARPTTPTLTVDYDA